MGISRLTVAASSVASATVATVKPGLQEVSQRYQRGELAESASTLLATGADLGLKGLTNLKGLLKTAVSQIDSYAGAAALGGDGDHAGGRPPAYAPQMSSYQSGPAPAAGGGGWNGWDDGRTGGRRRLARRSGTAAAAAAAAAGQEGPEVGGLGRGRRAAGRGVGRRLGQVSCGWRGRAVAARGVMEDGVR